MIADESSPIGGPVPHTFSPERDGGLCRCGRPRFTGVHVANDGTPEPDLGGIEDELDIITTAVEAIRRRVGLIP